MRKVKKSGIGRRQSLPIHRGLLLRKVGMWTRSKPAVAPRFLDVLSDDQSVEFELPIRFQDIAGLESSD